MHNGVFVCVGGTSRLCFWNYHKVPLHIFKLLSNLHIHKHASKFIINTAHTSLTRHMNLETKCHLKHISIWSRNATIVNAVSLAEVCPILPIYDADSNKLCVQWTKVQTRENHYFRSFQKCALPCIHIFDRLDNSVEIVYLLC